jgi:hypothetical protein
MKPALQKGQLTTWKDEEALVSSNQRMVGKKFSYMSVP